MNMKHHQSRILRNTEEKIEAPSTVTAMHKGENACTSLHRHFGTQLMARVDVQTEGAFLILGEDWIAV